MMICELCQREVERLTVHHLVPRQKAKGQKPDTVPTTQICSDCHKQIHALFNNTELAQRLNTLEKLKNEPQMQKFLSWIEKQDPNKRVKLHRPKK